jgi:heptaprenyl diphosphate synthase
LFAQIQLDLKRVLDSIRCSLKTEESKLVEYTTYFLKAQGKLLRPALVILSAKMGKYRHSSVIKAAAGVELLHMASLVHDDIIDGSTLRRNQPTVSAKFGVDSAVLLGDYLFSRAIDMFKSCGSWAVSDAVSTMGQMVEGEISQKRHRFNWGITEEEYIKTIDKKTASLLRLSLELGGRLGGLDDYKRRNLKNYATCLGVAYQMRDDILDYLGGYKLGKPAGTDILSGVITLPWIYYFHNVKVKESELMTEAGLALEPDMIVETVRNTDALKLSMQRVNFYLTAAEQSLESFTPSFSTECLLKITGMLRKIEP